jgi:hypothetical protein
MMRRAFRLCAVFAAYAAFAAGQTDTWRIETADAGGGGKYSSMKIDNAGNAHVAYVDDVRNTLRYAFRDARLKKWFSTEIDSAGGFASLALDSAQRPHVSYLDYGTPRLKYARWNGSVWEKQILQLRAKNISF